MRSRSRRADDWDGPLARRPSSLRRRLRTVGAIVQVLGFGAASFFLLPLVVRAQEEPIFVEPGGEATVHCEFTGQEVFPGDTVYCRRRIGTNTDLDVSMFLFVDEDSIKVYDRLPWEPGAQEITDERRDVFLSFWSISVVTRPVITRSIPEDRDVTYDPRFVEICPPRLLTQLDGGPNPQNADYSRMCSMGVVRGIASPRAQADDQQPTYERQYFIGMTERDTGEDQSAFKGWAVVFDLVFRARIPADDTCPSTRVNGVCTTPVYERP